MLGGKENHHQKLQTSNLNISWENHVFPIPFKKRLIEKVTTKETKIISIE